MANQLVYREYLASAIRCMEIYIDQMKHNAELDGIAISVFAYDARHREHFTYPDSSKVTNLVTEMNQKWGVAKAANPLLTNYTMNFYSEVGPGGFPLLKVQAYKTQQ